MKMNLMKTPQSSDLFTVKANLGVIVRGSMSDLSLFADRVEALASELGLSIVHKQASASRLWIREGDAE